MLKKNELKNFSIIFLTTISIFFSYSQIAGYPIRFSFLLAFPFLIYDKVYLNRKLIVWAFISVFAIAIFSFIMFSIHEQFEYNFFNYFSLKKIFEFGIIFYLIIFLYKYCDLVINNIFLIVNIYLIIFISFLTYDFINNFDQFFFISECTVGFFKNTKYLYYENSHFNLVGIPVIFYFIVNIKKFIKSPSTLLMAILFTIFSMINTSTTYYAIILAGAIFIILNNKNFVSLENFLIIIFLISNLAIYYNSKTCEANEESFKGTIMTPHTKLFSEGLIKLKKKTDQKILNPGFRFERTDGSYFIYNGKNYPGDASNVMNDYYRDSRMNLSFSVFIYSIINSFESFKKYPLGIGLNQYPLIHELSFSKFLNDQKVYYSDIYLKKLALNTINFNSGGSINFSKILAEFGIFGIILFCVLLYYSFTKKMKIEQKSFLMIFLIGQILFRGTGYFNNGFILILILSLIIFFRKTNISNDKKF